MGASHGRFESDQGELLLSFAWPVVPPFLRTACNNLKNVMVGQCLGLKLNVIHAAKNFPVGEIIVNSHPANYQ